MGGYDRRHRRGDRGIGEGTRLTMEGHGSRRRHARRGIVRDCVLVLLGERPRNGYQIMSELAQRTDGDWQPSPGTVYPCLAQLADEGLIEQTHVDGQAAYRLTDVGRETASALPTQPWLEATGGQLVDDETSRALWAEFRQLAQVLHLAAEQANPDQLEAMTKQIAEMRRHVFALLAEPATQTS
jgi:DNA-binding PadR family transcriptional regulator